MTKWKNFPTKAAAISTIRRNGVASIPHQMMINDNKFQPVFYPDGANEVNACRSHGYEVKFDSLKRAQLVDGMR